jgi:hypothetical protein
MKTFNFYFAMLLVSLITLFSFGTAQAQEDTFVNSQGQTVIVTTVPAPKETVVIPVGYVNCFTVPAGWNYKNVWVAEHKVCQYTSANGTKIQGIAWVDGYWACTKYRNVQPTQGECTNWAWQSGHWVKTLEVY